MWSRLLSGVGMAALFTGGEWHVINSDPLLTYEEKRNDEVEVYGALGWTLTGGWRLVGTAGESVGSRTRRGGVGRIGVHF